MTKTKLIKSKTNMGATEHKEICVTCENRKVKLKTDDDISYYPEEPFLVKEMITVLHSHHRRRNILWYNKSVGSSSSSEYYLEPNKLDYQVGFITFFHLTKNETTGDLYFKSLEFKRDLE